ncbi:hypothetical protein HGM15179_005056 [Zosterops borbonicus]|uniref:Teneurin N-terminal domain-containing protein n=1 Tax=Zosterops borbonicus TaxID=364589 RepID=A0A8K1GP73_9PASS|nr:hypothetical protein HGM15179_005056 [Zosterops borbonicus]
MDIKDRRHRSLTRGRCGKQCRYTSSSLDSEDCRVPTQKSYSSSETLKAYDHDTRMHYGNRVSDLVHRESDEFPRQGTNFTLAELGICEPSPHRSGYCSDMGILHQGYSLSAGSDNDSDTEGGVSPEHAIRLWGRGIKSRRSSGLSSRENSALTLTDSDNDNKSDEENGIWQLGEGNGFELIANVMLTCRVLLSLWLTDLSSKFFNTSKAVGSTTETMLKTQPSVNKTHYLW